MELEIEITYLFQSQLVSVQLSNQIKSEIRFEIRHPKPKKI